MRTNGDFVSIWTYLSEYLNQDLEIFHSKNEFENVVWKMVAILSGPQCINLCRPSQVDMRFGSIASSDIALTVVLSGFYICQVRKLVNHKLKVKFTWWRHLMEIFSALLAICAGNLPVAGEFPERLWRGALMFSLVCAWMNDWVHNREAGDLRRHRGHYDVTVMICVYKQKYIGLNVSDA